MTRRRPGFVVAAGLMLAATTACSGGELETVTETDDPGQICSPLDGDGLASFSFEAVTNTSDASLEVTDVQLTDIKAVETDANPSPLDVAAWLLSTDDWEEGGVGPGPLPDPGGKQVPNTVGPGDKVRVGFTVHGDEVNGSHTMHPKVLYTQGGRESSVVLTWEVRIVPSGETCGD